ncbi:UDP-glucose 4-epimerase family protein [Amphritea pacifica]|uniref:SDR family oxidoreductase n=1 Tax=Amphritea pacifica TaxID=2811233 RepID=A0ABS2W649_9GAMM|nr:SDR family oxidoreductase [Amphritea pacifica]MBN0986872.1 SDR family oxidoreductase [Amphritea pacifica]
MKILLTGATGFVGRHLVKRLVAAGIDLSVSVRQDIHMPGARTHYVASLAIDTDWSNALAGQQVVIHTAARAHIMGDQVSEFLAEYRTINVDGTLTLAQQAAASGIQRFIFISSIGVNGNSTKLPFTADDAPNPTGPYARSKYEAESALIKLGKQTDMEVVIIRPPLVYGPDAPGNFGRLVRLVERGLPLPLGAIHNKRSFVALDNLIDLIVTCIDHPAAANQVFLAGDSEDLSTTDLLRRMAKAMGKPSRLVPVPECFLRLAAKLLGKSEVADRLLDSLQVDISKARDMLGWEPPLSVDEGLKRCFDSAGLK